MQRRNSVLTGHGRDRRHHPGPVRRVLRAGLGRRPARARPRPNYGHVARPELGTEYFIDYVRHWLTTEGGFTDAEVYGGGLRVYTTLDMENQEAAVDAVNSTLDQPDDPSAALVSIDETGRGPGHGRRP